MNLLFILIRLLGCFIPKGLGDLIARGVGRICYYFVFKKAVTNHEYNLKLAYCDRKNKQDIKEITKKAIYNQGITLYEHTIMDRLNEFNYSRYLKAENFNNLADSYRKGKGVIILSAHTGNYEWGASLMAFKGLPVSVISIEYKTNFIRDLYERNRLSNNVGVFYIRRSFSGPIRFLKNGGVLAIAGDRNFEGSTVDVELFGHAYELPKGAFYLASRLNIPIVPAFSLKEKDGKYHVYFESPFKIGKNELKEGAEKYITLLEKYIRKYPEQWYFFDSICN